MNSCRLLLVLVTGLITSMGAQGDILDKPVSLKTEGDLIQAVSTTLQHAVATSEQYRGTEPRLQRFAREEIADALAGCFVIAATGDECGGFELALQLDAGQRVARIIARGVDADDHARHPAVDAAVH